jgi:hypothetical protein
MKIDPTSGAITVYRIPNRKPTAIVETITQLKAAPLKIF